MVAPGGSGLKRNSGIKKNILFAIEKGEKISQLSVVMFIIAQTKSRFFSQNFVAKISNESSSLPDYSDGIWGLKKFLPITALCRCNQVRVLIQKKQKIQAQRFWGETQHSTRDMRGNSGYGYTLWK